MFVGLRISLSLAANQVTSFLYKCPATALRAEQSRGPIGYRPQKIKREASQGLYMVIAYLLFFRLEESGTSECVEAMASCLFQLLGSFLSSVRDLACNAW